MQIEAAIPDLRWREQPLVRAAAPEWADRFCFWLLVITVFTIPFDDLLGVGTFGTLTRILGYATLCAGLVAVIARTRCVGFRGPIMWILLFAGWAALSATWSVAAGATIEKMGTLVRCVGLYWLLYEFVRDRNRARSVMQAYVFGGFVCVAGLLSALRHGFAIDDASYTRYILGDLDPNDLAALLSIGIPMAWYLGSRGVGRARGILNRLYIPLAAVAVLLTGSRGGAITLVVALMTIAVSLRPASRRAKIVFVLVILVAVSAATRIVQENVWARLMTIPQEIADGNMAHRTAMWTAAVEFVRDRPLTGIGLGAFKQEVFARGMFFAPKVAHNVALGVLSEIGLVGGFLLAASIVSTVRRLRFLPVPEKRVTLALLVTWAVAGLTLSIEYRKVTWLLLGTLAAIAIRLPLYIRKEERTEAEA